MWYIKAFCSMSSSHLEEGDGHYCTFDWGGGQRKFTTQYDVQLHFRHLGSITPCVLFFPSLYQEAEVWCLSNCPSMRFTNHWGGRIMEKQPSLDLQYLGKLCSICLPNSPSAATIWQKSPKAHYWRRDKAGEKNTPQIILKSQGTSSSAYICLSGV